MTNPDDGPYGPDAFMSDDPQNLLEYVNEKLPEASEGGPIEATKRAIVAALRDGFKSVDIRVQGKPPYIDLEYPLEETQYPGIWVQFTLSQFVPSGLGNEYMVQTIVNGNPVWTPVASFHFEGELSLSLVALTNLDRDQMADAISTSLVASRTPEVWVTQAGQDTQKNRSFMAALMSNPSVSLTPNFGSLKSGGQGAEMGTPWQPDIMVYTDSYSFGLMGETQIKYMHDGAYTLSRVDYVPTAVDSIADAYPPAPDPLGRGEVGFQTSRTL
jgi:hypothetical protein